MTDRIERERGLSKGVVSAAVWSSMTDSDRENAQFNKVLGISLSVAYLLLLSLAVLADGADALLGAILIIAMFIAFPIIAITAIVTSTNRKRRRPEAFFQQFRLCPCCGYALAGLVPEADGCVVCPECGAAWNLDLHAPPAVRTLKPLSRFSWWRDARGRRVAYSARLDPAAPIAARALLLEPTIFQSLERRKKWAFGTLVGLVATTTLIFLLEFSYFSPVVRIGLAVVVGIVVFWVRDFLARRSMLAQGWCMACLTPIGDLPSEPDGCTICPECGAAWSLPAEPETLCA